jgi:serine/threonine protein kinase
MIADVLKGIYDVANIIYAQVKLAEANQEQCKSLVNRIKIILAAVKDLEKVKDSAQYRLALMNLHNCLKECQQLVGKFSSKQSWFVQVFKAGSHKEEFEALNNKLEQCLNPLKLGLLAQQIVNREQDRKNEAQDAAYIQQNLNRIIKLNQAAIQEIKIVGERQEKLNENVLARLASLKMHLEAQQQPQQQNPATNKPRIHPSLAVGYYELNFTHKLAEGSLGTVYRGRWQEQDVAIKHLSFDSEADESYRTLIKEAQVLSQLRHPNVVNLYGVCLEPQRLCLVKEYLPGGALSERIQTLTPVQKQKIALEIAKGLSYLHSRQVLHLNLTSHHVLLTNNNEPKLNAFGLSRTKAQNVKSYKPTSYVAWQAPECFSKTPCTEAADVYSFGMVLWSLLTGQKPFAEYQGKDIELVKAILDNKRPVIPQELPEVYKQLLKDCWQTDPKKRPLLSEIIRRLDTKAAETKEAKDEKVSFKPVPISQVPDAPASVVTVLFKPKPATGEEEYQQGIEYEKQKKFQEAYQCYEKAVQYQHTKAFTNAGFCLFLGQGVTQNKAKAYQYFLKAANGKHARGTYNLAKMLEKGDGVEKNLPEALHWYEEAFRFGDPNAKAKADTLRNQLLGTYQGNLQSQANR